MPLRSLALSVFLLLSVACCADQLRVVVTDPSGAAVGNARVTVYRGSDVVALQSTTAEGVALFTGLPAGSYRVAVLAPGFAPADAHAAASADTSLAVRLDVAAAPSTVVVSATRTPVTADEAGAPVGSLDSAQLQTMQPAALAEGLRFLPGAVVSDTGQLGGLTSLFVRGGESRYNKVIIDGVPVNDPGGTFNFGVVPMAQVDRVEFVRGADSTLYGSDAMTSVVQLWSATGHTRTPEFVFGADGGNYATAHGYASLSGARGRFDYDLFADQFNTAARDLNDGYSNSAQGGNLGLTLSPDAFFRLRVRHSNSRNGVQGQWDFNGRPLLPPDSDGFARNNDFLASAEFDFTAPDRWRHRVAGYEYNEHRLNQDSVVDPGRGCDFPAFLDCSFQDLFHVNRAGFDYQGDYMPRSWSRTTFGYEFEDENGFEDQNDSGFLASDHGLRRNHNLFVQQIFTFSRLTLIGGLRYVHNESFGDKAVPRVAVTFLARRGGDLFSSTRLRFVYAQGIKEPRLEESFGIGAFGILPNPSLQPEENRSFEAGIEQLFASGKYSASADYFHNDFHNLIAFVFFPDGTSQNRNLNQSLAHGAEFDFHARPTSAFRVDAGYTYLSTQVLVGTACDAFTVQFDFGTCVGGPLLRRPRHSGSLLFTWLRRRYGGTLGATFVGRRPDSDFTFGLIQPPIFHAAGYARFDLGAWFAFDRYLTAYASLNNAFDKAYEDVVGYPALGISLRTGLRFTLGGE